MTGPFASARLVTPEAVVLELPTASVGSRLLCRAIDIVVTVGAFLVLVLLTVSATSATGWSWAVPVVGAAGGFAVLVGYPVLMEAFWGGRTVGKALLGLRVVRADGGPATFGQAVTRGAVGIIEVWGTSGGLGIFSMLLSPRDQRLGDMAAGTLVLRERRANVPGPVRFDVPPGCEALVHSLDVGTMTQEDYELVRSFLLRWDGLREAQRDALAAKVAAPLWQRFRHPLPASLGPAYYLACLGVAYQRRHHWGGGAPLPDQPGAKGPGPQVPLGPGLAPGHGRGSGPGAGAGGWSAPA